MLTSARNLEAEKKKIEKARREHSSATKDKSATVTSNQGLPPKASKPCHYEAKGSGNCRFGDKCKFSHDPSILAAYNRKKNSGKSETIAVVQDADDYACMLTDISAIADDRSYLFPGCGDLIEYVSDCTDEKFPFPDGKDFQPVLPLLPVDSSAMVACPEPLFMIDFTWLPTAKQKTIISCGTLVLLISVRVRWHILFNTDRSFRQSLICLLNNSICAKTISATVVLSLKVHVNLIRSQCLLIQVASEM